MAPGGTLVAAAVLLGAVVVGADILEYTSLRVETGRFVYWEFAKYGTKDSPTEGPPGHGKSYIDVSDMRLRTICTTSEDCKNVSTTVEVLAFPKPTLDESFVKYWSDYCCTDEARLEGLCTSPKGMVVPKKIKEPTLKSIPVGHHFAKVEGSKEKGVIAPIKNAGLYILLFSSCDPRVDGVEINGRILSMNPYGWLPGSLYGCLAFFSVLALVYLLVGAVWAGACLWHRDELLAVQLWLSLVIFLGMLESSLLFFDYHIYNTRGTRDLSLVVLGALAGVSKRGFSRAVVLMVSLGYGVVRPSLGEDLHRVLMLCGAYVLASASYQLTVNVPNAERNMEDVAFLDVVSMLSVAVACVDCAFYMWTFRALQGLIQSLAARRQETKHRLYLRFRAVLAVSLAFAVGWAAYCVVATTGVLYERMWDQRWTYDAVWEVCYVVVLSAMALLWAPSVNSKRYAYAMELAPLEDLDGPPEEEDPEDAEYGGAAHNGNAEELPMVPAGSAADAQAASAKMS